jgi:hypothetical protein
MSLISAAIFVFPLARLFLFAHLYQEKDKFVSVMTAFAHAAVTRAEKCQTRLDTIGKECASLGALYGETNGAKWEELFKIFDEFVQQVRGGV